MRGFGIVCVAEQVAAFRAARVNRADVFAPAHFPNRRDLAVLLYGVIRNLIVMHLCGGSVSVVCSLINRCTPGLKL